MRVHWTRSAQEHLDAIYGYIALDSEVYALRTVDRITARSRQIGTFPWSGRRVPEYDRETVREVFDGPYRIVYQITEARLPRLRWM